MSNTLWIYLNRKGLPKCENEAWITQRQCITVINHLLSTWAWDDEWLVYLWTSSSNISLLDAQYHRYGLALISQSINQAQFTIKRRSFIIFSPSCRSKPELLFLSLERRSLAKCPSFYFLYFKRLMVKHKSFQVQKQHHRERQHNKPDVTWPLILGQ